MRWFVMSVKGLFPGIPGQWGSGRHTSQLAGSSKRPAVLVIAIVIGLAISLPLVNWGLSTEKESRAEIEVQTVIPTLAVIYQHKDTNMPCVPCPVNTPHAWNDTAGPDNIYGNLDDCPHCSCYCAPASIAMISTAYGSPVPFTDQDWIYDAGKATPPEVRLDGTIQTHGVGMYHGSSGTQIEVQLGMSWSLMGIGIIQHDFLITMNPLAPWQLQAYISAWQPVLWLDHNGWPANQSAAYPPADNRYDQGHAKVIGGYDDMGTAQFSDDLCLIFDPWPEYTDKGILPTNAMQYSAGVFDPYWLPLNDVNLTDINDIFLVPMIGIPEFSEVLPPIVGVIMVTVVSMSLFGRGAKNTREVS